MNTFEPPLTPFLLTAISSISPNYEKISYIIAVADWIGPSNSL